MNPATRTALMALGLAVGMTGVGYASVPLYRLFCQVTGFGGTTQKADAAPGAVASGKTISVRFDSNTAPGLGWRFTPEAKSEEVVLGARDIAFYSARNIGRVASTGTATFNVTPSQAGKYFSKIQCFCFTEQTLEPGSEMRMPVIFYVDPEIMNDPATKDIEEITLSYTFYPVAEQKEDS